VTPSPVPSPVPEPVLTVEQAVTLAERIVEVMNARLDELHPALRHGALNLNADRERVASDLAGLRDHNPMECALCHQHHQGWRQVCPDWLRYSDGLRRTARLYGVTQ
jgi:hypothetical protein